MDEDNNINFNDWNAISFNETENETETETETKPRKIIRRRLHPPTPQTATIPESQLQSSISSLITNPSTPLSDGIKNQAKDMVLTTMMNKIKPEVRMLLIEIWDLESKLEELYDKLSEELKTLLTTPADFSDYFETTIRVFFIYSQNLEDIMHKKTLTDEENILKTKAVKKLSYIKQRMRNSLFPHLQEIKEIKDMNEKLEKKMNSVSQNNEEMKQVRAERKKNATEKDNKKKRTVVAKRIKDNIRVLMMRKAHKYINDYYADVKDNESVNSLLQDEDFDIDGFEKDTMQLLEKAFNDEEFEEEIVNSL